MANLDLWNKVCKTDPETTKTAKVGGRSITAVSPQNQIMKATEMFGPYGKAWGFKKVDLNYSLVEKFNVIVFKGVFFFPEGEFEIINSSKLYMDRKEQMFDADFAKKIETDALTKGLSKLGFNADIFMGKFDDHRYVSEMKEEFAEKQEDVIDEVAQAWIDTLNADISRANEIEDLEYKNFIMRNLG